MSKFLKFLSGKKTYLLASVALLLAGLLQFDVIDTKTYEMILQLMAPLGLVTLRAGLKK